MPLSTSFWIRFSSSMLALASSKHLARDHACPVAIASATAAVRRRIAELDRSPGSCCPSGRARTGTRAPRRTARRCWACRPPSADGRSASSMSSAHRRRRRAEACPPPSARPAADATAATIEPAPGIGPAGVGYSGSWFARHEAGAGADGRDREAQPVVVEVLVQPDHDGVDAGRGAGVVVAGDRRGRGRPPPRPRPPHTSTRSPAATSLDAAVGDETTSPSASTPIPASVAVCSASGPRRVGHEHDAEAGAPAAAAIASTDPGIGSPRSHTTPSRSHSTCRAGAGFRAGGPYGLALPSCRACHASNRSAPCATPAPDLGISSPALRRGVARRRRHAGRPKRPQHRARRRAGGRRRPLRRAAETCTPGSPTESLPRRRRLVHDLPDALHRRHRPDATWSACSGASRWSTTAPAGCSPTSARPRRRRPTASTSRVRRGPTSPGVGAVAGATG